MNRRHLKTPRNNENQRGANLINRSRVSVVLWEWNNDGYKQLGFEEKKAAVNEEMRRLNQLPSNSTYVVHRSRVLSKIMQLLSAQRTKSQDEELELLFAGLSL
ncbi:Translation initiation factor IF-2 like [Heracleum sosnowskyi]|uniref:Translation initiation factor IF-2 like n=1 Tax=Heracleum sosnowskyi TaxID=360622 RepID=A0AAD8H465_9APIA|nr:Translation initiation factor IF-2 like [Heracleum sosnowskyi]